MQIVEILYDFSACARSLFVFNMDGSTFQSVWRNCGTAITGHANPKSDGGFTLGPRGLSSHRKER